MSPDSSSKIDIYVVATFEKKNWMSKIPFIEKHYCIKWIFLGLFFSGLSYILLYFLNNKETYYMTILCLTFNITLWPCIYITFSRKFYEIWSTCLVKLFWDDLDVAYKWYEENANRTFVHNLKNGGTIISFLTWVLVCVQILCVLPKPFPGNDFLNFSLFLLMFLVFFIASWMVNIVLNIFVALIELSKFTPKLDYFSSGHIYHKKLQDYYMSIVRTAFIQVVVLSIGFIYSPYTRSKEMPSLLIVWIIVSTLISIVLNYIAKKYTKIIQMNLKKATIERIKIDLTEDIRKSIETKKYLYDFSYYDNKMISFLFNSTPFLTAIIQIILLLIKIS